MYEDVGQNQDLPPPPPPEDMELEDPDDIYEECGEAVASAKPPALPKSEPPPRKSEPLPPLPHPVQGEMEDVYDDGFSAITEEEVRESKKATESKPPELPPSLPPGKRREPPPTPPSSEPPPRPPPKAELPPIPAPTPPPPLPDRKGSATDARTPPPIPSNPPPRGAARVPQLRTPFMDRDEDFENLFYSKWDCAKDSSKELDFKKGDIIHVLSKDFDSESWWVGELDGHIGLVPKDFLCPAFQLVA